MIPQVPLFTILQKFDGQTEQVPSQTPLPLVFWLDRFSPILQDIAVKNETKQYILTRLPRYLIVHLKRFTKNNWFMEKNPTIVNFPVKNLQMRECAFVHAPAHSISHAANLMNE